MHAPLGVQFFSFSCSFGQKMQNNSTFGSWCTPLRKILDPPLVAIELFQVLLSYLPDYHNTVHFKVIHPSISLQYDEGCLLGGIKERVLTDDGNSLGKLDLTVSPGYWFECMQMSLCIGVVSFHIIQRQIYPQPLMPLVHNPLTHGRVWCTVFITIPWVGPPIVLKLYSIGNIQEIFFTDNYNLNYLTTT